MNIGTFRQRSPLLRPSCPEPRELPCRHDEYRAQGSAHAPLGLIPRVLMASVGVLAVSQGLAAAQPLDSTSRLLAGVEDMREQRVPTPTYLGGSHPDWKDSNDHCYSIYFRVAIRQRLLSEVQAEQLMARMQSGEPDAFLNNLFPHGYQQLTLNGSRVESGAIPAGQLVSMDRGDHVMMSTGRLTDEGEHEVYSFKGGGVETPVWGDSVGYHPGAKIHKTTIESELRALQLDEQPIDKILLVTGRSALQP